MHEELRRLYDDHECFRRLLRLLEAQIHRFQDGQDPDYELMRDVLHYMTEYPDQFHHPAEDLIFERLGRVDPASRPLVEAIEAEHEGLVASGAALLALLEKVLADTVIPRATVESAARKYLAWLRDHMDKEESSLFPLAARRLSAGDWEAVGVAVKRHDDPLFSAQVDRRYRAILEQLQADA